MACQRTRCIVRSFCLPVLMAGLWIVLLPMGHPEVVAVGQVPDQPGKVSMLVTAAELEQELKGPQLRILDTRSQDVYAQGHLAGAIWVDVDDWKTLATGERGLQDTVGWSSRVGGLGIDRETRVVVYGDRLPDTGRIWWLLKYVGVAEVAILDGGWQEWVEQNRPIEKSVSQVAVTVFQPKFQRDRLVEHEDLKESLRLGNVQMVDTRSTDEFTGKDVRGVRGGHIPGATHLEWTELLTQDGRFKTRDELRILFRERRIPRDETVVCY